MIDLLHLDVAVLSPPVRAEIAHALETYLDVSDVPRRDADFCAFCGGNLEQARHGHKIVGCRYVEARLDVGDLIVNLRRFDHV